MSALLRIPAGRSVRREGTKFIDAQPQPGNIELERLDDDLLEFSELMSTPFRRRQTNEPRMDRQCNRSSRRRSEDDLHGYEWTLLTLGS